MHATIMTFDQPLPPQAPALTRLVDDLAGRPGFTDGHVLHGGSSPRSRVIALWQNAEHARLAATSPLAPAATVVAEVRDDLPGADTGAPPSAGVLAGWAGPMDEETAAAGRAARRQRIAPVLLAIPGVLRMIALFEPVTGEPSVLTLLSTPDVADTVRAAVATVELPPDLEFLRTPDRLERCTITQIDHLSLGEGRLAGATPRLSVSHGPEVAGDGE
jgi:hypothetical protein